MCLCLNNSNFDHCNALYILRSWPTLHLVYHFFLIWSSTVSPWTLIVWHCIWEFWYWLCRSTFSGMRTGCAAGNTAYISYNKCTLWITSELWVRWKSAQCRNCRKYGCQFWITVSPKMFLTSLVGSVLLHWNQFQVQSLALLSTVNHLHILSLENKRYQLKISSHPLNSTELRGCSTMTPDHPRRGC